ncbi:PAS domain S-box protein [Oculatella sp. LEGE 06141]|uniref:PAS domain-containing protein n=1 Tax=Oculatella sp. LEGE 06141 TaxID=1828648 RepID=UPI0018815EC6|nr:PAS domain S-box protein [Oculatella sp. LEGE 06141]MBE9179143.1 PAS domain S-box protein [Oculatella sp. LEGE 06141]
MASRTITFRFAEEVIEAIEARAKATGSNRTAVLMQALSLAYGVPSASSVPVSTTTLQQRLTELEQQVVELLQQLTVSVHEVKEGRAVATRVARPLTDCGEPAETRSQLTAQLEHQANMLDQILSATPDLVFVQDRMGRFTYINPVSARVLGFRPNYFLGKTYQELGFDDEFSQSFSAKREVVFRTGRPASGDVSIPTIHEVRDYEYIISPILAADGSIDTVVFTARDITERKRTEIALRESEEEYRNLFELANDSILIVDVADGHILNANRNAARRLGYTRRELLQLSFVDIEAHRIEKQHKDAIASELQRVGNVIYEYRLRRKDKTEIPVEISSRLIEYGDRLAYQSFFRDIAERQQVLDCLRLLESAIHNAHDAIVMTEIEPIDHPKIVQINERFAQLTGYRPEDVIGRPLSLLYGENTSPAHLAQMQDAMAQRQPVKIELLHYRKDGTEFWVEQTIAPVPRLSGEYTHWIWIQREITRL